MSSSHPLLPIVTPDSAPPPGRSQVEKFGGLFLLGAGGLVVLVVLLAWFFWNLYALRDVWAAVYVLNDPNRAEVARVNAALELARNPHVNSRQLWDMSLSRVPPPLGRYILAEALPAEAIAADPSAYALTVARSEGWPDWLRLLLVRPLAYDDGRHGLPSLPLEELRRNPDPILGLWAAYIQAVARDDREATAFLESAASDDGPNRPIARLLFDALRTDDTAARRARLDEATLWLRSNHPGASALWVGWDFQNGRLVRVKGRDPAARDLQSTESDAVGP